MQTILSVSCRLRCDDLPLSFTLPNTLRAAADVKVTMVLSIISMGVPVWFQLSADHGVSYGNLRCLGCHDHRLACPRNLLRLQVQERAVAEDYFLIKRMCLSEIGIFGISIFQVERP